MYLTPTKLSFQLCLLKSLAPIFESCLDFQRRNPRSMGSAGEGNGEGEREAKGERKERSKK
ncbi:hypothetical protein SLEP1_g49285 [Rubroshorea leprosula]|uniref:Uncharacterized protein n=1 Tax=Rubroshorea leprosula TaxID=152421 RepID=A0AAV5LYK1_9ROSI|nr:hypothetical protein SLEP1_g49285 [Rubroshorea leprosula]